MAGIAGITAVGASSEVSEMLEKMNHRGNEKTLILEKEASTYGITWNESEDPYITSFLSSDIVCDYKGPDHFAWAKPENGSFTLHRDPLGVAPLYFGRDGKGVLYFASEVKALALYISEIIELTPGNNFDGNIYHPYYELEVNQFPSSDSPENLARELRLLLDYSIESCSCTDEVGSWLSGGLDSSAISAIVSKKVNNLMTFAAGLDGAPDLEFARMVSEYIGSKHYEVIVTVDDMLDVLPEVIYHLESFDALLVRSSITNYLVGREASQHVSRVFSGEGGDELFAGYEYLKSVPAYLLPFELVKITNSLHNTALQRVDRCSSAHGIIAHVPFLCPEMVKFAFSVPAKYKISKNTEKWILRKALDGELPDRVLKRPKAKFWEGAGVKEVISSYADSKITDNDFFRERQLPNGWILNTKEEMMYYRIFKDHFGGDINLQWMGRTAGSPVLI